MAVKNVIFKIQADTAQLRREIDALNNKINESKKGVSSFTNLLAGAGAAFGGIAIGSQLAAFGQQSLKAAADFETLNIQFKTFLGSAEAAQKTIADLEKFSVETPFTPEQVSGAARSLLAFGLPAAELESTLRTLGDVSAGTGKDLKELSIIYGQVRSTGKLMGQDLLQLINAGFNPLSEISKKTGKSIGELKTEMEKGNISFAQVEEAFKSATSEGGLFFNLTKELSESVAGRISTLAGEFNALQRDIGLGLLPVFETLVGIGSGVISFLKDLPKTIEENRAVFALFAGAVAFSVGALTKDIQLKIKDAVVTAALTIKEKAIAFARLQNINLIRQQGTATVTLTGIQRAAAIGTNILSASFKGLTAAIASNPIGLILTGLSVAATLFLDFSEDIDDASDSVERFADTKNAVANFTDLSTKKAAEETAELKRATDQLKKTTFGTKERNDALKEYNEKFGTTVKNLKDEAKFNEEVETAALGAAEAIKIKASAAAAEESLVDINKEEFRLNALLLKQEREKKKALEDLAKEQKDFEEGRKQRGPTIGGSGLTVGTSDEEELVKYQSFANKKKKIDETYNINKTKEEIAQAKKAKEDIESLIPTGPIKKTGGGGGDGGKATVDITINRAKLRADLEKELRELETDIEEQPIEFLDPTNLEETKKQIEDLARIQRKRIEDEISDRKAEAAANKTLTTETEALLDKVLEKRLEIAKATEKDKIAKAEKSFAERDLKASRELAEIKAEETLFNTETLNEKLKEEQEKAIEDLKDAETTAEKAKAQAILDEKTKLLKEGLDKERDLKIKEIERLRDEELKNTKLTEEEKKVIIAKANLDILKLNQDYLDEKNEATKNANDTEEEDSKQTQSEILDKIAEVTKATIELINAVIEARIAETERAISNQEKRVERATEIADKGNAELLQLEEERLNKLNEQKAKYVRQQQALALIELAFNSAVAIAKAAADTGALAPFTIATTLIALAAGIAQAKAAAQSQSFASGGYTGDGGKYEEAGVVHRGEFVVTKEKTKKFRSLLEDIHRGRDPILSKGIGETIVVVNNAGLDDKLTRIEKAIRDQRGLELNISERGIHGIVSRYQWKDSRIRNAAR